MLQPQYSIIENLNVPTEDPVENKTFYNVNNGAAGNGNAILSLMASVGIQPQAAAATTGTRRGRRNGKGGAVKQFLTNPITPGQIILLIIGFLGTVALVTWIAKKL